MYERVFEKMNLSHFEELTVNKGGDAFLFISKEQVDYIQSMVPITEVILATGYKVIGNGRSKAVEVCPACGRDHTHIKVNSVKNLFNCYSPACKFRGNQFHWVMEVEGLRFPEAVKRVAEIGGIELQYQTVSDYDRKKQKALQLTLDFYISHYDHAYLASRGISEETVAKFQVGFAPGGVELKKYLNKHGFNDEFLLEIGLIRLIQGKKMDKFYNSIIIPDIRHNYIHDFYARSVDPAVHTKHLYLYGRHSMIGYNTLKKGKETFIVEAPIDAMSIYQMTKAPVISIGGAGKFGAWYIYHIKNKQLVPIMALDNDESGKLANVEAINLLLSHKIPVKACTFSGYKDANQLLLEGSREDMIITPGEEFVWKYQLSKMPKEFIKKFLYHDT